MFNARLIPSIRAYIIEMDSEVIGFSVSFSLPNAISDETNYIIIASV